MRILVVSNLYPPYFIGGYELGCRDVVEGLRLRGHDVQVLTSTYGLLGRVEEGYVHRWMTVKLHPPTQRVKRWAWALRSEIHNQASWREALRRFKPELVYLWNLSKMSAVSLANLAEQSGQPVAYYISDEWPGGWKYDIGYMVFRGAPRQFLMRLVRALATVALRAAGGHVPTGRPELRNAQFTSAFIRQKILASGYDPPGATVLPWGVDLAATRPARGAWPPRRLLYAGQLIALKGVHTAIRAFARYANTVAGAGATLTLVGKAAVDPDYETELREIVGSLGVAHRVEFRGGLDRVKMPSVYAEHDALIFPSEWDEPFSIALVEAMAAGLAVVATATGGTPEIVRHGDNGLLFPAGDSIACAERLATLAVDEAAYHAMRRRARETVEASYDLEHMRERVHELLTQAANAHAAKLRRGQGL